MLNTVIFDMDGLLIDSEPLWQEAGTATLAAYNAQLTTAQYHSTIGLRSNEWIEHWFKHFNIDMNHAPEAEATIIRNAIDKITAKGKPMPGVQYIMQFFKDRRFKIGVASSSPMELIDVVLDKLQIHSFVSAKTSAEHLPLGKPHPQVFLNCATLLQSPPTDCICFEDSFNGMIAAKAARMKCVIVPTYEQLQHTRWNAADLKISSLQNFNGLLLEGLMQ